MQPSPTFDPTLRQHIQARYEAILAQIGAQPITVVAVTKYTDAAGLLAAYEAGIRHFGENRVQDALEKQAQLPEAVRQDVTWHLIGHLQGNKAGKTVGAFDWIHSVDSLSLAETLSDRNLAVGRQQNVLLQVNVSGEESKTGFSPEDLRAHLPSLLTLSGLRIEGLMTMAPLDADDAALHQVFCGLRDLRDRLRDEFSAPLPHLSMGMSRDYIQAIACGATIVRVGSSLFR
jgi:pyridoxal phosphate enzyme (YggS family)